MNETMQVITARTTAVLLLAILIGGPVACSVRAKEEATRLAINVCAGNLNADAVRAAACVTAINNAKGAGK